MKTNPSIVAIAMIVVSVMAYVALVSPLSGTLLKARNELFESKAQLDSMRLAITQRDSLTNRIAVLERENARHRDEWISPMLDSYAMRAKSFLGRIAEESGLVEVEYGEGDIRMLPMPPDQMPAHRTARRTVRVKALADYAAAASFLLRAEHDLPLVTLQSFSFLPAKRSNDRQEIEMVFEWPCEGMEVK